MILSMQLHFKVNNFMSTQKLLYSLFTMEQIFMGLEVGFFNYSTFIVLPRLLGSYNFR